MSLADNIREFEIDLTGTCNLRCDRCSRNYLHSQHLVGKNIRSLDEIIHQLEEYPALEWCTLAGQVSEPTLYPQFLDFLKYLKSRQIRVDLYTNASRLDEQLFANIGKILSDTDRVIFTVCGSTQELHQTYRKGSKLLTVLLNAEALRNVLPIDVCQYIRFKYNFDDWKSNKWRNLGFTEYFWCESEGPRLDDGPIRPRVSAPVKEAFYQSIFNKIKSEKFTDNSQFLCSHIENSKIYIDQYGKVFPCYAIAEYDRIELKNFDYILYNKKACKLCSLHCRELMKKYGLDFIC